LSARIAATSAVSVNVRLDGFAEKMQIANIDAVPAATCPGEDDSLAPIEPPQNKPACHMT
jgi:hypothetical protein